MSHRETSVTLIERYVQEVGRYLPSKQRVDIQAEIKSLLQDILEEKSTKSGLPVDEALTLQVLKEFGPPEKVAASYSPPRYLIGPKLLPIFWLVLRITLATVVAVVVIVFAVRLAIGDVNSWQNVVDGFGSIFNWLVAAVGWVVVTFAILEKFAPQLKLKSPTKEWDPAELLKKPDTHKIPLATPITAIIFTLAALVIFNVFPAVLAIKNFQNGEWTTLIAVSDNFFKCLPLFNILWVLTVAFHGVTLIQRRWTIPTRLFYIGLQIYGIVIIGLLLNANNLINIDLTVINAISTTGPAPENLASIINLGIKVVLGIALGASIIEIGKTGYDAVSQRK